MVVHESLPLPIPAPDDLRSTKQGTAPCLRNRYKQPVCSFAYLLLFGLCWLHCCAWRAGAALCPWRAGPSLRRFLLQQHLGSGALGLSGVVPGLGASWRVESPQPRDRTLVLCIGRWILNPWSTREVFPAFFFEFCVSVKSEVTFGSSCQGIYSY